MTSDHGFVHAQTTHHRLTVTSAYGQSRESERFSAVSLTDEQTRTVFSATLP